jgi:hypothetical protein
MTKYIKHFEKSIFDEVFEFHPLMGAKKKFETLKKGIEKLIYTVSIPTLYHRDSHAIMKMQMEGAQRSAAREIGEYLIKEGFVKVEKEELTGYGVRLVYTIYAAKDIE